MVSNPAVPLPDFSAFHDAFRDGKDSPTPEGDVRRAFYVSYDDSMCEYLLHDELRERVRDGASIVSASFVTPYPPGFPVLVPGQVFGLQVLSFIDSLDVKETQRRASSGSVSKLERPATNERTDEFAA